MEYQGKSFEMAQNIDLSTENSTVEVTAVVSEGGVSDTVEQITGLEEVQNSGWVLYPNPVKDKLFIMKEDLSAKSVEICIYDGQGKVLSCTQSSAGPGVFLKELDFTILPKGIYIISFRQAKKIFYRKIVKY